MNKELNIKLAGEETAAVANGNTNGNTTAVVEMTPEQIAAIKEKKATELREQIKQGEIGLSAFESVLKTEEERAANLFYIKQKEAVEKLKKQLARLFEEREADTKAPDCLAFITKLMSNKNIQKEFADLHAKHGNPDTKIFRMGIELTLNEDGTLTAGYCKAVKPAAPSVPGAPKASGFGNGSTSFSYKGLTGLSGRAAYEALMADNHLPARTDFSGFNAAKPVRALMATKPELGITETAKVVEAPKTELPDQQ